MAAKGTPEARKSMRRRGRRRFTISLNTGVALLLAVVIFLMLNYLSYHHYMRWDWSRSQYYTLSEKTVGLLDGLTNRIDVVVFLTPDSAGYEDVRNLLLEYEYASPRIDVEFIDPHRNIGRTEELASRFDVDMLAADVVVFDHAGRTKYVRESDLDQRDVSMGELGPSLQRTAFKGEQVFSSAIQSVTQESKPTVYFLKGHNERDIENFDRLEGYSDVAKAIERDNIEVKTLVLGESQELPDDCDALVIAGPEKKLFQPEVDLVRRYLEENGKLLLLVDAATESGLEPVMKDWGVRLSEDVVMDGSRTLTGRELFITDYGPHPIASGFQGVTTVMYFPRSVVPVEREEGEGAQADLPRVTVLAQSSPAGWAESNLDANPMEFDTTEDQPGPVPVAVAGERGPGQAIDVEIRPTRFVVIGDSDFLANGASSGGNEDLFMSSLNWLLEREELMAIAPKPIEELRLVMDRRQLTLLFWAVVAGLPGAVAVLGGLVWLRRRA